MAIRPSTIADGEREHAAQPAHTIEAPFFVSAQNHLRVGSGAKMAAAAFECVAQLLDVVNFAVENDPTIFRFVGDRLLAAFDVDDAEPSHA
jgi:hypothetical protein